MKAAIDAVPYASAVKFGLQFKRRFWEEDEEIYGGISYTDLPIRQISYPSTGFNAAAGACCSAAIPSTAPNAYEFTSMAPAERVARAVEFGAQIHPQYRTEFENGIAVGLAPRARSRSAAPATGPRGARAALRQSVPDRRPDRSGRRARLLHSGLAGGRDPLVARRDHPAA